MPKEKRHPCTIPGDFSGRNKALQQAKAPECAARVSVDLDLIIRAVYREDKSRAMMF